MIILGIDTSARYSSLAVIKNERLLAEHTWECKHNHSVEVLPALDKLLGKTGLHVNDISAVGVAIGPGSFNGLRVGLSIAKGIAFSLNIPIMGIPSLEAIAFSYAAPGAKLAPVIQAASGMLSTAFYKAEGDSLILTKEPFLATTEDIAKLVSSKTIICGYLDDAARNALVMLTGNKAVFPSREIISYGTNVARLASARLEKGQADNVHTLEPFYLKKPHITKPGKKPAHSTQSSLSKAVIWDMDGVLVDSAIYHLQAWQKAFAPLGVSFPEEYFWKTFGSNNNSIISGLGLDLSPQAFNSVAATKEKFFREMVSNGIKPLPGAIDLIMGLKKRKIPMAVASSAPLENIRCILKELNIRQYFRVLIGQEDVSCGKPDPEVFLKAAEKLGIPPERCVVIEDSLHGLQAARKAKMACLAVGSTNPASMLKEADFVVKSLDSINTEDLLGLIK
ncbi:MAG: tRNA (adenosine(37)-N6)-threonylcarbamoyltransferase complex dimerization subunit type 1 TsaB [Dehalococcoidales bacterium]